MTRNCRVHCMLKHLHKSYTEYIIECINQNTVFGSFVEQTRPSPCGSTPLLERSIPEDVLTVHKTQRASMQLGGRG